MAKTENDSITKYSNLLLANHNIVLTGAPGTGKTYLAQEIAKKLGATIENGHCKFVQFHPSYDYTDFVEGLRPTNPDDNGNIGFERKDGVFKEFCKTALKKIDSNFDESYEKLISSIRENGNNQYVLKTVTNGSKFAITVNSNNNLSLYTGKELNGNGTLTKATIKSQLGDGSPYKNRNGYFKGVEKKLREDFGLKTETIDNTKKKYIFIIDEINRGEISKIFGELFFSIDPGYRGIKGTVQTQYQNLIEEGDEFYTGFYVPENVYIIGTMNDIDRSVESMDFAMRRRFTWCEVTAEESAENMELSEKTKSRMKNLNEAIISNDVGLTKSYQIGASYFLNVDENKFEDLWNYKLQGLLREYLRGDNDIDKKMNTLHTAFI